MSTWMRIGNAEAPQSIWYSKYVSCSRISYNPYPSKGSYGLWVIRLGEFFDLVDAKLSASMGYQRYGLSQIRLYFVLNLSSAQPTRDDTKWFNIMRMANGMNLYHFQRTFACTGNYPTKEFLLPERSPRYEYFSSPNEALSTPSDLSITALRFPDLYNT